MKGGGGERTAPVGYRRPSMVFGAGGRDTAGLAEQGRLPPRSQSAPAHAPAALLLLLLLSLLAPPPHAPSSLLLLLLLVRAPLWHALQTKKGRRGGCARVPPILAFGPEGYRLCCIDAFRMRSAVDVVEEEEEEEKGEDQSKPRKHH